MQITEIKIVPVDDHEIVKAYVSITIDDCIVIKDIKIINGKDGYFLSMPSRRLRDGRYIDLVHPIDKATRRMLEEKVMSEFRKVCQGEETLPSV